MSNGVFTFNNASCLNYHAIFMSSGNDIRRSDGRIGINEIIVTVPGLAVKAEEVVRAFHSRNGNTESENSEAITKDVGKMKEGLGIKQIRLPGYSESNVTFVADAIYTFIMKVTSSDRDTERIRGDPVRNIYYASESNPDRSRPEAEASLLLVYSKLLGMDADGYRWIVDMFKEATMIPVTYACAGGGISLADAAAHVRASCHYGSPESALIITADTSIYDNSRAPNAEFTQGAGATLVWLTRDPEIATILYDNRYGGFHMPLSDFTKFGHETPIVHGKFSERVYVYTVAKALEKLEGSGEFPLRDMGFFVTHVPFPKQSIYFASFLFAHYLKNYRKELFDEIQARPDVGREPIGDNGRITNLMDRKFREFNSEGGKQEESIIRFIEDDAEISAYWEWMKRLRNQPEFSSFLEGLHINSALILPSEIGNSYSSSAFVAFSSLVKNAANLHTGKGIKGILAFYGSGAIAKVLPLELHVSESNVKSQITIPMGMPKYLSAEQYLELHKSLITGDAARTITKEDLVRKDMEFLHVPALSEGFHVRRRNPDGTGEYVYSDGSVTEPVLIRY